MNEPLPPPLPGAAPPPAPPPYRPPSSTVKPAPGKGSLLKGMVLGWAAVVGGYVVLGFIAAALGSMGAFSGGAGSEMLLVLMGVAPWLGLVAWLVYYISQGEPRTAAGFGLAVVSMLAVAALLVAACFTLLAGANWH